MYGIECRIVKQTGRLLAFPAKLLLDWASLKAAKDSDYGEKT